MGLFGGPRVVWVAAPVSQAGNALFPVAPVHAPGLAVADSHQDGRIPHGQSSLSNPVQNVDLFASL